MILPDRTRDRNYYAWTGNIQLDYSRLHAQPKASKPKRRSQDLLWTAKMMTKLAQATLLLHLCVVLDGVVLEPMNGEASRTIFTSEMFNLFVACHSHLASHVCENSSTAKRLYQTAGSTRLLFFFLIISDCNHALFWSEPELEVIVYIYSQSDLLRA